MRMRPTATDHGTRHWRWLDRWLEPRWRALLTWVTLAAVTGWAIDGRLVGPLLHYGVAFVFRELAALLSFAVTPIHSWMAALPSTLFLLCWFQPMALRLGLWRGLVWIFASTTLGTAVLMIDLGSRWGPILLLGHLLGIPGLAAVGRRSRPWMSLISGVLITTALWMVGFPYPETNLGWYFPVSNLIYAAIMLYGTELLPHTERDHPEL